MDIVALYNYMSIQLQSYALETSLGYLSTRFSRLIIRRINQALTQAELAITTEQYSFLVQLWHCNGLPQGSLAERTDKDKTTIARLAAGLETAGLIVRAPSTVDARERLVFLSDSGMQVMDQATLLVRRILDEAQSGIDEQQLEICRSVLQRAYDNLLV